MERSIQQEIKRRTVKVSHPSRPQPRLRRVWNAADGKAAEAELGHLVAAYRDSAPKLADWLETAIPEGLAVFALPERHQKRMPRTPWSDPSSRRSSAAP